MPEQASCLPFESRQTRGPQNVDRAVRARCPGAECVEEWGGRRVVGDEQVGADVKPRGMHQVGRYAVQIDWSDGHSTGIYSWDYLLKLRGEPATAQA